ncbi:hypothetical protein GCM10023353_33840 [Tomitella cavernea]|uniref:AMP-dependent synthetase/ligase domain-containing protein n=1 Tax=Tomitella cavernea TaxID=1387982 RepID=A0ABP9CY79_9ACTN
MAPQRQQQQQQQPQAAGDGAYDALAYRTYFENAFTYINGFRRNVRRFADRSAIDDLASGRTWTYRELGGAVDALAAGLAELGVGRGDVVAYQLFNGAEFAQLYLATQVAGAVGSPLNFRLASGETSYILTRNRPRVFFYDTENAAMTVDALRRSGHVPETIVAVGPGEPITLDGARVLRFDDVAASMGTVPQVDRTIWEETTRLYTSGTTGMPKGVPMNSAIEIFSAHDVIMQFPLAPEDKTLNMSPWFHRGGLYLRAPTRRSTWAAPWCRCAPSTPTQYWTSSNHGGSRSSSARPPTWRCSRMRRRRGCATCRRCAGS